MRQAVVGRAASRNATLVRVGAPSGTVTFLFTDVEGSTRLWELAPSAMGIAMARHDELVRSAVQARGGYVFSTGGDGFAAAFARAGDAIAAAVGAQSALAEEPWPADAAIGVRMGLHTGEVEERDGNYFGSAVNRAARLMALAHGGQVVASAATADVAADAVPPGVKLTDLGEHPCVICPAVSTSSRWRPRDSARSSRCFVRSM